MLCPIGQSNEKPSLQALAKWWEHVTPVIVKKSGAFETEEGCLSLIGVRKTIRYEEIEVEYENMNFKKQHQKFSGWTAQIIQHECDHLEGIII